MKKILQLFVLAFLFCSAGVSANPAFASPLPPALKAAHPIAAQQGSDKQHAELGEIELKVMTFNIWLGGEVVDFSKVIEAIQKSGADIVGLQEAEGNTRRIAAALGWYADERLMVISRYPLIEPADAQSDNGVDYLYVQIAPGQVVAMSNVHLTSDPYGPTAVRDGKTLAEVLEIENTNRVPEIKAALASWQEVTSAHIPLLVTGDFNSPSYRDWITATVKAQPHMLYPVEWPASKAMEDAGFVDTFRSAHPDPVADPGRTWTYGYPYPRLKADETIDRIDFIFASGITQVVASQVIGEPGTPNVDIQVSPYPSDHRSVVSTVRVTPVEPPVFVAVDHVRVESGTPLLVRYHTTGGEATDRLAIVPADGKIPDDEIMWLPPQEAEYFGAVRFGTGALPAGEYDVVLTGENNKELSRQRFWVVEPAAVPVVKTSKATYGLHEQIDVEWANAPARMRDWVGIYPADTLDLYNGYLGYVYTGATVSGKHGFDANDLGDDMLPAGKYVAALLSDDGYAILAETPFTVGP